MLKYKTGDKMNIDLEKAKQEFLKYTEKFDLEEKHIKRKQLHSLRVMEISKKIAESLKLTQEEIELATLIGLLHDIARFEQYTKFETFNDLMSIDHADYGVEITVISENVYEQFMQNKIIKREKNKEQDTVDKVIAVIAFIFDINFR